MREERVYVCGVDSGDSTSPPGPPPRVSAAHDEWHAQQQKWWRATCRREGTREHVVLEGSGPVPSAVLTAAWHGRVLVCSPDGFSGRLAVE